MEHPLSRPIDVIRRGLWQTATFAAAAPDLQQGAQWWSYRSRLTHELRHLQDTMTAPDVSPFGVVHRRLGE
jgi:hypothetical protein